MSNSNGLEKEWHWRKNIERWQVDKFYFPIKTLHLPFRLAILIIIRIHEQTCDLHDLKASLICPFCGNIFCGKKRIERRTTFQSVTNTPIIHLIFWFLELKKVIKKRTIQVNFSLRPLPPKRLYALSVKISLLNYPRSAFVNRGRGFFHIPDILRTDL